MATTFTPAPTYADPVVVDERTKKARFNPIWLKWFLDVSAYITASGGGGGGAANHNDLAGIQGGGTGEYYHFTASEHTSLQALIANQAYGDFSDSTTQTIGAANTPQALTFNTTTLSSGVALAATTSRVTVTNAGKYLFTHSLQLNRPAAGSVAFAFWLRINGTDLVGSASLITLKGTTDQLPLELTHIVTLTAGQYVEIIIAADSTNAQVLATAAQAAPYARPAIPSVHVSVKQIAA